MQTRTRLRTSLLVARPKLLLLLLSGSDRLAKLLHRQLRLLRRLPALLRIVLLLSQLRQLPPPPQ